MAVRIYICLCVSMISSLAFIMGMENGWCQRQRTKGGRKNPPVFSETQGFFQKPKKPKEKEKEKENEKEKEKENEKENENKKESLCVRAAKPPTRPPHFCKPGNSFCQERDCCG